MGPDTVAVTSARIALRPLQSAVFDAPLAAELFLLGRILFGGVLAFNGLNHFFDIEAMTAYADSKGVPKPRFFVATTGGMLIFGGLAVVVGIVQVIAAGTLVVFFVVVTPIMHDFWTIPDPTEQQQEMIHFLKNATMLGAVLVLLALGATAWPYVLAGG